MKGEDSLKETSFFLFCQKAKFNFLAVTAFSWWLALVYFEEMLTCSLISEELKDYLLGDRAINKIFTLGNSEFPVSWDNEIKLWTFLETRAALLLKTYKTTSEVSLLPPA